MKKLFFFLLFSSFAFGQLSKDSLQSIVKNYFEKQYVQQNFKDPYSYEFVNITSIARTKKEVLNSEISIAKSMSEPPTPKKFRKEYENEMKIKLDILNSLSEDEKNKIDEYICNFDAYGANSYGNKVLGRYVIVISSDGKNIRNVFKRN